MPVVAKLTKKLTKRELPVYTPEVAVQEYFLSKFEERIGKKKPEWDLPRLTPSTELVGARRELLRAEELLVKKRVEQVERRKEMDKHWETLRHKEKLLKQSFIKFNKFVKENLEKRERAERKIHEEQSHQARRTQEITDLELRVEHLSQVKESMEKHIKDYKIYENYLEQVVAATPEFESVHEILSRYETLADARLELAARQAEDLEALENARSEMAHLTEEKSQLIMALHNEMAELQTRYDHAKSQSLKWETAVSRIKNTAAAKTLELGQVKTCCWNMYQQMCKRKDAPVALDINDVEHQLVDIKRTIIDLKKIVRIARRRSQREAATVDPQIGTGGTVVSIQPKPSSAGSSRK